MSIKKPRDIQSFLGVMGSTPPERPLVMRALVRGSGIVATRVPGDKLRHELLTIEPFHPLEGAQVLMR
jgi:hypothetical protein